MILYQLTALDTVIRIIDGAQIPNDPRNSDRIEYEKQRAAHLAAKKPISDFEQSYAAPPLPRDKSPGEKVAEFASSLGLTLKQFKDEMDKVK